MRAKSVVVDREENAATAKAGLGSGAPGKAEARILEQLEPVVGAAISLWAAAGLPSKQLASLNELKYEIVDLRGDRVGEALPGLIRLDRSAAGCGWFIDSTPMENSEFPHEKSATRFYTWPELAPAGRMDLLSVLMHEMGHVLGLPDNYSASSREWIMHGRMAVGERRLPGKDEIHECGSVGVITVGLGPASQKPEPAACMSNPGGAAGAERPAKRGLNPQS